MWQTIGLIGGYLFQIFVILLVAWAIFSFLIMLWEEHDTKR